MNTRKADVVIIGGGLGGTLAAWTLANRGLEVIMTEETDWIGGQLTSQAVPPDEHPWIEQTGCTAAYRAFRNQIRSYYAALVKPELLQDRDAYDNTFNPGNGWVSRLCHEPNVAHDLLQAWLCPHVEEGRLHILYHTVPLEAHTQGDAVQDTTVLNRITGEKTVLTGQYYVDATECGDVLPLAGVEYIVGAESQQMTGEPHALTEADPADLQAFTVVMSLEKLDANAAERNEPIAKPASYDWWRSFHHEGSPYPLLSWWDTKPNATHELRKFICLPDGIDPLPLWTYRRTVDASQFRDGHYEGDLSLINWPQNDYSIASPAEMSYEERDAVVEEAKQLSLSLLYWLQTEAPREDGRVGYPEFRLYRPSVGTDDGLAKSAYIRESRRIHALYTITEHDVSKELRKGQGLGIRRYEDSVGVGHYSMDLHTTTKTGRSCYIPTLPYEIPLGSLIPKRVTNVLPACKNIGTTQLTNGCYRLHPTEWNIGESVGHLIAYSIEQGVIPRKVYEDKHHLSAYQAELDGAGVQRSWPFDGTEIV
ncbi:FAD-dependent oxidoreductase [Paenibacillus alvei]|uniref:FAD-dependent oxidoreductase n=1 Tax=Paenibacillus alvei TaxID=44250 RepID=A0ABT4E2U6_PAEAL|nr:FAD-dependent oxidoreductase [Paenibacillus alvei]MCY9528060.1 FAD-dependent oxidoreductase [Paenibacillus alvei]